MIGVRFAKTSSNQHYWWAFTTFEPLLQTYIIMNSSLMAQKVYDVAAVNLVAYGNAYPHLLEIDVYESNNCAGSGAADVYLFR